MQPDIRHVLLVDASEDLHFVASGLQSAGIAVSAATLEELPARLEETAPDAVIIALGRDSDPAALRRILEDDAFPTRTPAIALVPEDLLSRFDVTIGFDDFVVQPVRVPELILRVRHQVWLKSGGPDGDVIRAGDLIIDRGSYRVYVSGRPVDLTYKEYQLLLFLASNPDRVFTRETLLNRVWGYEFYGGARTVDVHIRRIRSKIEDRTHTFIETVRNVGYCFRPSRPSQ
ncbi:MAG TPA: response regulator transcription factor [Dehalococcoidia bacterium]|nr:response regulator transcription factor [Dehalococcoidia bacterium]